MDFKKPRVAMWFYVVPQTGYRNDGACLFLQYNLHKLLDGKDAHTDHSIIRDDGGNVVHIQPNEPTGALGNFDFHLLVDHGEDGIGVPLDFVVPHPNAYWVADSHLGYEYRLKRAKEFDHVFVSHPASLKKFISDGIDPNKIHYLPWAAEETCYRPFPVIKKWDWCFIGHLNNEFRINLCDRFIKEFGLGDGKGYLGWRMPEFHGHNILEDVARKFSQSRVVINEAIKDDVNMRVFEALACRSALITEELPELRTMFQDKMHLRTYKTIDEAVQIAKELIARRQEAEAMAERGYQEFLSKHTYMHRLKYILKTCLGYEAKEEVNATDQVNLAPR